MEETLMRCIWCEEVHEIEEARVVRKNGHSTLLRSRDGRLHSFSTAKKEPENEQDVQEGPSRLTGDGSPIEEDDSEPKYEEGDFTNAQQGE